MIYNLGHDFRVGTNIRRADVTGERGWVILEIERNNEDIEQGLAWVTAKGVGIELLDNESLETS